jgi:hypothetical protein
MESELSGAKRLVKRLGVAPEDSAGRIQNRATGLLGREDADDDRG